MPEVCVWVPIAESAVEFSLSFPGPTGDPPLVTLSGSTITARISEAQIQWAVTLSSAANIRVTVADYSEFSSPPSYLFTDGAQAGDITANGSFEGSGTLLTVTPAAYDAGEQFGSAYGADFLIEVEVCSDEPVPEPINCECSAHDDARSLLELRTEMMVRMGWAARKNNPPPGVGDLLTSFLQTANRLMYRKYPTLRTVRFFQWELQAGVKFYDVKGNSDTCPAKMDPRKIKWVGVERDGVWYPLQHGIPPELYTWDQPAWPVRYEIRECIEIWPRPADGAGRLMIKGDTTLQPFEADTDKPTVDDEVVFLMATAMAKGHYRHPDAGDYVALANQHIRDLVAGLHQSARYIPGQQAQPALREPVPGGDDLWFPGYTL